MAAASAGGGRGARAELGEVGGAEGGGDPVEGAGEEVGGEGAGEVVPGDAQEGGDWSVAGAAGGDGGAEGEEDVDEEEGVADDVHVADLGLHARRAEGEAVGEGPELVAEGGEHDGLPAAVDGRFGVEGLCDDSPGAVDFWEVEVELSQPFGLELLVCSFRLFSGGHQCGFSLCTCWCDSRPSP